MRSSNSSFPPVQLENPLFLGCGRIERSLQQVNGSHGVYAEVKVFCLTLVASSEIAELTMYLRSSGSVLTPS
jgi:hypothetical protein